MKELDIRFNSLQNIDILAKLPSLEILHVSKNSITSFESDFDHLKVFYFDRNPITNVELRGQHIKLTTLNLYKTQIAALPDSLLDAIPCIEKLVLNRNHITTLPVKIGTLKCLRHLEIVANQLDAVPPEIGSLINLERLDLHDNNIIQLPEQIWNLTSLVYLNVASNLLESFPKIYRLLVLRIPQFPQRILSVLLLMICCLQMAFSLLTKVEDPPRFQFLPLMMSTSLGLVLPSWFQHLAIVLASRSPY